VSKFRRKGQILQLGLKFRNPQKTVCRNNHTVLPATQHRWMCSVITSVMHTELPVLNLRTPQKKKA